MVTRSGIDGVNNMAAVESTAMGRSSKRRRKLTKKTMETENNVTQEVMKRRRFDKENIDLDELTVGSRVWALCEEGKEWQATIKRSHERKGEHGFKIHYDGMKRSTEFWVPLKRIVAFLDKQQKKKNKEKEKEQGLQQPKKNRRVSFTKQEQVKGMTHLPQVQMVSLDSPLHGNVHEVVFCRSGLFDDFDLFDGELLRSGTEDEVLKDL